MKLREYLDRCATALGLPLDDLCGHERIDKLLFAREDMPAAGLERLSPELCQPLVDLCGSALQLAVRLDAASAFALSGNTTAADYDSLRADLIGQPTAAFELILDKRMLLAHWGIHVPRPVHHVFLFASRCEDILRGTVEEPSQLESLLWPGNVRGACLVLVADSTVLISGPYLSVVAASRFAEWSAKAPMSVSQEELVAVQDRCSEVVRWEKPWLVHLTPHALRVSIESGDTSLTAKAVLAHWTNASLLFLADRVREQGTNKIALFVTEKHRAQVTLVTAGDVASVSSDNVLSLGEIAEWAYEARWGGDRIRMVQAVISQALAAVTQPAPPASLLAHAPALWRDVQWHWKTFIGAEIDRYTVEERNLEGEVSDTVGNFDTEVADMIKSLTATMLGAVGALIGSMIAAAFKEPFNHKIFSTGLLAFFVYLVAFPGFFGLAHHWIRFRAISELFARRRIRYERVIGEDRVNHIVGPAVANVKSRFKWWFGSTAASLALVALLCIAAIFVVPIAMHFQADDVQGPATSKQPSPGVAPMDPADTPAVTSTRTRKP